MKLILIIFTILLTFKIFAGPFKIDLTQEAVIGGDVNSAASRALNSELVSFFDRLEAQVNKDLPDADASTYLKGMANSSVMAAKGTGTDYATDIDLFIVGASVGVGMDMGNNSFSDFVGGDVDANQIKGFGLASTLMAGVNLGGILPFEGIGFVEFDKTNVFLNFFAIDINKSDITIENKTFGFHIQYHIVEPISLLPMKMAYWDGVKVSTGYEYNYLNLKFVKKFTESRTESISAPGGPYDATATFDGTATVGAEVSTHSIPIEASTSFQWLYLFSTYLGLGADLNFGSSKAIAQASSDVDVEIAGATNPQAQASIDLGQEGSPSTFLARGFIGQQFNISLLKLDLRLSKSFIEDLWGVHLGVKFGW